MDKSNQQSKIGNFNYFEPDLWNQKLVVPFSEATAHSLLSSKFSLMKRQKS